MTDLSGIPKKMAGPSNRVDMGSSEPASLEGSGALADRELRSANQAVQEAIAAAEEAANPGGDDKADGTPPASTK